MSSRACGCCMDPSLELHLIDSDTRVRDILVGA